MDRITFKVNGKNCSVGCETSSDVMLVDYLREVLGLRGTKFMCREGGCGVCCVSAVKHPGGDTVAVNSCMTFVTSCQDWEITTIEGIGNRKAGYSVLQKTLAENNGTQCGYCSPGFVQNMYSLLKNGNKPTMLDIEKSIGGNICRCTGYRPILQAFKKFGADAPNNEGVVDIEDLFICKKTCLSKNQSIERKTDDHEDDWCIFSSSELKSTKTIEIKLKDSKLWFKVWNLQSVFDILNNKAGQSYMLVYGNTAKGAYPIEDYPKILIDITSCPEIKDYSFDQNLIVGAGITLNEFLDICKNAANEEYFGYLIKFAEHINLVANISIRNLGSIAGNLMIKHQHNEFSSDIYLLLETVGAYLSIRTSKGVTKRLSMQEFLKEDMKLKIIVDVILPPLSRQHKLVSFKIMPRSQNAHAIVNAGFLFKLSDSCKVEECRMTYGGLSPCFIRAEATEKLLVGKILFNNDVLQEALNTLDDELVVVDNPPDASKEYRRQLALSLFYKGLLSLCPKNYLNPRFISGASKIHEERLLSSGTQTFETDPSSYPLTEPIPRVDGLIKCAGEADYTFDLPAQPREVHAAYVLSTIAVGEIDTIDATAALNHPGVLAFYTAKDIPGDNNFLPLIIFFVAAPEKIFDERIIKNFNQPIGVIVAETQELAYKAAKLVKIVYKNTKEPVIDVKIAKNDKKRLILVTSKEPTSKGTDVVRTIERQNTIYEQIHFQTENLACVTVPTEEGVSVHITSHWMNGVLNIISGALKIPSNHVDVHVRRLGGSFGLKLTRATHTAVICSLVAQKLNRPCRMIVPLTTCSRAFGKRFPCHTDYECQVNAAGVIQSLIYKQYEDNGHKVTETLATFVAESFSNCYNNSTWDYILYDVITDSTKKSWCRSPGHVEGIGLAEHVIERISYELSLDPFDVRIANLAADYKDLENMAEELKKSSSYKERKLEVNLFNQNNRWRKRGLRVSLMRWAPTGYNFYDTNLSICHADGTVVITPAAVDMGQGLNMRAVQICAYYFKIPLDMIQIKATNTTIAPNSTATGGSIASQSVVVGVKRCCEAMLERLEPTRNEMDNPKWPDLIAAAYTSGVDLQAHSFVGLTDTYEYSIYGAAVAETEIDVLTGEYEVLRVDILQDAGKSINPDLDIGQVEGAFTMGLGYWTSEQLAYSGAGELLTDRTWNYHVPLARDIPRDFRITLRKNSYSYQEIFGSKGIGEAPICLSVCVAFALREAITAARLDVGIPSTDWFDLDGPFTVERVGLTASVRKEDFKFT